MSAARWFTQLGEANGGYFLPPLSAADLTDLCQIRDHFGRREGGHRVNRRRAAAEAGKSEQVPRAAHLFGSCRKRMEGKSKQESGKGEEEQTKKN